MGAMAAISELSHHFLAPAIAFEEEQGRLVPARVDVRTATNPNSEDLVLDFSRLSLGS